MSESSKELSSEYSLKVEVQNPVTVLMLKAARAYEDADFAKREIKAH